MTTQLRASQALFVIAAISLCILISPLAHATDASEAFRGQYRLGPGDKIQIAVDGEEELSLETTISPNGNINYTFLGEIPVAGLSIKEFEKLLYQRLSDGYVRNPVVSVSITEYRIYYVNGEVTNSGGFPYRPGLTVRKAVVLAGGFTEHAARSKVTIIRGNDTSFTEQPINLNDPVYPGDIITVPEGFW